MNDYINAILKIRELSKSRDFTEMHTYITGLREVGMIKGLSYSKMVSPVYAIQELKDRIAEAVIAEYLEKHGGV